jgi:hypothetical protein
MIPSEHLSTMDKPLLNLHYLIVLHGGDALLSKFSRTSGFDKYKKETETKSIASFDIQNQIIFSNQTFEEYLSDLFKSETRNSLSNIDKWLNCNCDDIDFDFMSFFNSINSDLDRLLDFFDLDDVFLRYKSCKDVLDKFNVRFKLCFKLYFANSISSPVANAKVITADVSTSLAETNKYPRIFVSDEGYNKFLGFLSIYKKSKRCLAHFSFFYYEMKKINLMHANVAKVEFRLFLLDFDVSLDKIKRFSELGHNSKRADDFYDC